MTALHRTALSPPPFRLFLLPVLLLLASLCAAAAPADVPGAMATVVARVRPALVRIHAVVAQFRNGREVKQEDFGSGVIIDARGYLITNHHVAGDARYITCTLADKRELEADLVGSDALSDIAVLKLRGAKGQTFPHAAFGDSSRVTPGERVFAMGSPLAFSQSVTMGIVSNTELVMPEESGSHWLMLDGEDVGSIVRWIAHDARIFPGNSGGPLVNGQGQVIGINEVDVGLGGAIPGNLAKAVAAQLIARGKVSRSWLGFSAQPLLKSQRAQRGVLLTGAVDGSPAALAGVQSGDILTRLGKTPVDVRFPEELPLFNQLVMALPAGREITAEVRRRGKAVTLRMTPRARPAAGGREEELAAWGICASDLSPLRARELQRTEAGGVLVTSTRSGGPADAAKPGLAADDVITTFAGKPVSSLAVLRRLTAAALAGMTEPMPVLVGFARRGQSCLTVVKIGTRELDDRGQERPKPWLPVALQVLTRDLAEALGLEGRTGERITQVYPHSAAQQAGLQVGDVITALDGAGVEASEPEDADVLPDMIRQGYHIGDTVSLTVYRDGKPREVMVTLPAAPPPARELKAFHDAFFAFGARELGFMDRVRAGWSETQQGALVESVEEGGWAALARLASGDLIVAIDGAPVTGVDSLAAAMGRIAKARPDSVTVAVKREDGQVFLELHARWPTQ